MSQSETKGFSEDCRGGKSEIYVSKGLRASNNGSQAIQSKRANKQLLGKAITPMLKELKENLHGLGMFYAFMMYEELL